MIPLKLIDYFIYILIKRKLHSFKLKYMFILNYILCTNKVLDSGSLKKINL